MDDPRLLLLSEKDNVLVVCRRIEAGEAIMIGGIRYTAEKAVELAHKLARRPIAASEKVVKYGVPIGSALRAIQVGEHVHVHNIKSDYTKTHLIAKAGS